jgi:hypothetical protein
MAGFRTRPKERRANVKIFETETKVNFVDENGAVVGYDTEQQCCEMCWYEFIGVEEADLDPYVFDLSHFCDVSPEDDPECNSVEFALHIPGNKSAGMAYLRLHNSHNGYYAHGFDVSVGGQVVRRGEI